MGDLVLAEHVYIFVEISSRNKLFLLSQQYFSFLVLQKSKSNMLYILIMFHHCNLFTFPSFFPLTYFIMLLMSSLCFHYYREKNLISYTFVPILLICIVFCYIFISYCLINMFKLKDTGYVYKSASDAF